MTRDDISMASSRIRADHDEDADSRVTDIFIHYPEHWVLPRNVAAPQAEEATLAWMKNLGIVHDAESEKRFLAIAAQSMASNFAYRR